jgi:FkbM family methyltransferase
MEPKLLRILQYIVALGALQPGYIVDAGANDGSSSVLLAKMFPNHTVLAIEPLQPNVREIRKKANAKQLKNLQIKRGGLGDASRNGSYPTHLDNRKGSISLQISSKVQGNVRYPIFTIDALFSKQRLAFAHWDVEGSEPMVLDGALATILRDRPLFTVETHEIHMKREHASVMERVSRLNYTAHKVNEICGWWKDCRNYVCVPNEWMTINSLLRKHISI